MSDEASEFILSCVVYVKQGQALAFVVQLQFYVVAFIPVLLFLEQLIAVIVRMQESWIYSSQIVSQESREFILFQA